MNFQKSSCSTSYNVRYVSPYERLLTRLRRWKPKKAKKEEDLKKLCQQGLLAPFEQPNYSCYFINSTTDIFTVDKLIDEAKLTNNFSMDTEGDALTHRPATIQVEFIRPNLTSTVIIIEVNYLPSVESPLFKKIQQLSSIIFTSNNFIYSWGDPVTELENFIQFNLFSAPIQMIPIDVQRKYDSTSLCGLQDVIESTFKQYLDKTATLGEWSCGVDLSLGTYTPQHVVGAERTYRLQEERKYRLMLKEYAMNDVFAVTKLVYKMNLMKLFTPPPTAEVEEVDDDEPMDLQQEISVELKPPHESTSLNEEKMNYDEYTTVNTFNEEPQKISIELEITPSDQDIGIFDYENFSDDHQHEIRHNEINYNEITTRTVHVEDEPELKLHDDQWLYDNGELEPVSDDEIDNGKLPYIIHDEMLPEVMKIHRPFKRIDDYDQRQRQRQHRHQYHHHERQQHQHLHQHHHKQHQHQHQHQYQHRYQHQHQHQYQHQQQHQRNYHNQNDLNKRRRVHVRDEPNKVRNSYYLGPQLKLPDNPTPNQIKNRRRRANRYIHEVIRKVYARFTTTQIKDILRAMNITVLNVNMREITLYINMEVNRRTRSCEFVNTTSKELYIGLKDDKMVDEVEDLLHLRMFTKDHYQRYMKKKKKN